jgi:hypothetical protein
MFKAVIKTKQTIFILSIFILLLSSCTTLKVTTNQQFNQKPCYIENRTIQISQSNITPFHQLTIDSVLYQYFSPASLKIANGIGALDLIEQYVKLKKTYEQAPTPDLRIETIELSQKINRSISLASLEISSIASELDCEEERISQLADFMNQKEADIETKLTVAAMVVGASGAILTVVQDDFKGTMIAGVTAGLTEAAIGTLILLNKKFIHVQHERNALSDIWKGVEHSEIFPPSVWHYLCYYNPKDSIETSVRYQIVQRWMEFEQIKKAKTKQKNDLLNLYFGLGGKYSTEQLYNRANMYDQLESYIKLMNQELMLLSVEMNKL